jgi:putative endonuclease
MTVRRKQTGNYGEAVACDYLQAAGFTVLSRNWRRAGGELDIIAAEQDVLVFVEVRTRSTRSFGTGEESVDWRKQRQVRKVAALYLAEAGRDGRLSHRRFRFDVVVVEVEGAMGRVRDVRHVRNAF